MRLESPAFAHGDLIPSRYTCDGEDLSPPLVWEDVPEGTSALALVLDDPDAPAGTWVHWVVFNLPPSSGRIPEGASESGGLPEGADEGANSWGGVGYRGPCPPSGTHRYFFKLHALDLSLENRAGATASEVLKGVEGHVLAECALMGRYARR